jgi:hypothetical protein
VPSRPEVLTTIPRLLRVRAGAGGPAGEVAEDRHGDRSAAVDVAHDGTGGHGTDL